MMVRAVLFASLFALAAFAVAPTASAAAPAPPCVLGSDPATCLVSVESRVCVTFPCDTHDVCVAYGRVCPV